MINFYAWAAIAAGAAAGAWLRWGLGLALNPLFPTLPLGTLAANLVGGFFMGIAMEYLAQHATLSLEARLAITTGFLGGLTTFSTFSGEVVTLLARQELAWAMAAVAAHVAGSVIMTILGIFTLRLVAG